jgi:hypothetical protein
LPANVLGSLRGPVDIDAAPFFPFVPQPSGELLMRNGVLLLAFLATVAHAGCGGGSVTSTHAEVSNLHGGILVPLPEKQGYVELLNDRRQQQGRAFLTNIVAYLLQDDQKTPIAQLPSSMSVTIDTTKGRKTIPLQPKPNPDDAVGSARFVSDFGPFELSNIGGEVAVAVAGKTLTATFRGPR